MADKARVVGRGRGRGRGAFVPDTEKRPGQNAGPSGDEYNGLAQITSSLKGLEVDSDTDKVVKLVQMYGSSEKTQQEGMQQIYAQCQNDWHFAEVAVKVCKELVALDPEGPKFRAAMLRVLQADFKRKEELRQSNPKVFLGCLSFLCQIFSQIKTASGDPFLVLTTSVLDALDMLLDQNATDEEIEVAVTQLRSCGGILLKYDDPQDKRFMSVLRQLREIVLDSKGSRDTRNTAIDIMELSASSWNTEKLTS